MRLTAIFLPVLGGLAAAATNSPLMLSSVNGTPVATSHSLSGSSLASATPSIMSAASTHAATSSHSSATTSHSSATTSHSSATPSSTGSAANITPGNISGLMVVAAGVAAWIL